MTEINIPFNEWSINRIKQGIKTATTRTKKYGKQGDIFTVGSEKYIISGYLKTSLGIVIGYLYREEGAASPTEFIAVWNSIYPKKNFDPEQTVWIHFFQKK